MRRASVHPWRFNEARSFSPLRRDKEFLLASFAGVTELTGVGENKLRDRQKVTTNPLRTLASRTESGNYAVALLLLASRLCVGTRFTRDLVRSIDTLATSDVLLLLLLRGISRKNSVGAMIYEPARVTKVWKGFGMKKGRATSLLPFFIFTVRHYMIFQHFYTLYTTCTCLVICRR